MPPKRKAALKSKKAEQIAIEDDMSRITVRRPLKSKNNYLNRCIFFLTLYSSITF